MKTAKLFFIGVGVVLLTSCTPRVMTDIMKVYPVIVPSDSVRVFEPGDSVPNSAEAIGKIKVVDDGWTTKCNYDYVLGLACEETSKAGGNGFVVTDHLSPSFWGSSCHQISGFILRMPDMKVIPDEYNPVMSALEVNKQLKEEIKRRTDVPRNIFSLSAGYGLITSEVYTPYGRYGSRSGAEWRLEYEHIYEEGVGVSLQYSGFKTTFPRDVKMLLTYVAPSLIYRGRWERWMFKAGVGVGYFACKAEIPLERLSEVTKGIGVNADIGMEYMLTRYIGLGISVNTICGFFLDDEKENNYWREEGKYNGISRINFKGGVHFYF